MDDKIQKPWFHEEGGIPVLDTELERIRGEQAEAKRRDEMYRHRQLDLSQKMTWFTAMLAFVGVIGTALSLMQYDVARRNADAARDNAAAAKAQAEAAKNTVEEMRKGGTDTHELAVAAKTQADAAKEAADTSTRSLAVMQRQFRVDERPYLLAEAEGAVENGEPNSAQWGVFLRQADGNYRFAARVNLANTGKSPAAEVVKTDTELIVDLRASRGRK